MLWVNIFKAHSEIKRVVTKAFSIPPSQGGIERIFSLMNMYCSGTRNNCAIELIKAELSTHTNFEDSCQDFFTNLSKNASEKNNKEMIKVAQSEKKYRFKN